MMLYEDPITQLAPIGEATPIGMMHCNGFYEGNVIVQGKWRMEGQSVHLTAVIPLSEIGNPQDTDCPYLIYEHKRSRWMFADAI